jgi:hypothetical protein
VAEDGISDELFELRALFSQLAVHVARYAGLKKGAQIILRVELDAIECAYSFKSFAGDDEYLFSIVA